MQDSLGQAKTRSSHDPRTRPRCSAYAVSAGDIARAVRQFLGTETGDQGKGQRTRREESPDGCQGDEKKTRTGPVLVSRGRRRPRRVAVVAVASSSYRRAAISNGSGEQAALLVPVMHARQAPSGVFIIAPRSLVPVAEEERERTTTWRRWRHRRRTLDTSQAGERQREMRKRDGGMD